MTDQKALKRAVRARMGRTGENYTTARRALTGQDGGGQRSPLAEMLAPGRTALVVCGGGMLTTFCVEGSPGIGGVSVLA